MPVEVLFGLLIPFVGTVAGAGLVFFAKGELNRRVARGLAGFAAGVMVAASIWSLIQPAIESSEAMGRLAWAPAVIGFWAGTLFLLALDHLIPHLHVSETGGDLEGPRTRLERTTLMVLAVALHNIPEGMAAGVVFAGWMAGSASVSLAGAMTLALGLGIQNFPEGAIVSLPLRAEGASRHRAFIEGAASGIVEPIAAALTILAASHVTPLLPYFLGFAAGAMIYVVVEELIPEMSEGSHSNTGVLMFALGFTLMLALDVGLG